MQKEIFDLLQDIRREIELIEKRLDEIEQNSSKSTSAKNENNESN